MRILGIDTSCDETGAAVVESGFRILSDITRTQHEHAGFGGVVPELAARAHMRLLSTLVKLALEKAGMDIAGLDGIAATVGPGLPGALAVGVVFAKTLAQTLRRPIIPCPPPRWP